MEHESRRAVESGVSVGVSNISVMQGKWHNFAILEIIAAEGLSDAIPAFRGISGRAKRPPSKTLADKTSGALH